MWIELPITLDGSVRLCGVCQQVDGHFWDCPVITAAEDVARWLNWKGDIPQAGHAQNVTTIANLISKYFPAKPESPIIAFNEWLERWVADNGRKLTQVEYGIAYAAFIAAHPGQGPIAHTMSTYETQALAIYESLPDCEYCGALCPDDAALLLEKIATALERAHLKGSEET